MKFKKILLYFFLLIFLIGFIYSSIKIMLYIEDSKQNAKINDTISNDVTIVKNGDENIEEYFNSAMERIQLQSAIFINQWNNIYADDIEKIKDEENEQDFNFAIPLDGAKIRSYE